MLRSFLLALAFVGAAVSQARAQSAAPPAEIGVDVSSLLAFGSGVQAGPRVVVNVNGRDAVQFTVGLQKLQPWLNPYQRRTDLYLVAYKRLLHAAGPVRVSATLGGGFERTVYAIPESTFGNPPITFPASTGGEIQPVFTTGGAIAFRLAPRASIVFESSVLLYDRIGGRLSAGLVVPVGSYPTRAGPLAPSVPWAELDAGERAWVTIAGGRDVDGEVVAASPTTLTLRTQAGVESFTAGDVQAIDVKDPIRNGTVLGAKIGILAMLVPSILATGLVCTLEDGCDVGDVLWVNGLLLGSGVGVGAATGALVDSLREHRVPLYRRGSRTLALTPIVGRHRLGGGAVIRW